LAVSRCDCFSQLTIGQHYQQFVALKSKGLLDPPCFRLNVGRRWTLSVGRLCTASGLRAILFIADAKEASLKSREDDEPFEPALTSALPVAILH
jgi:hypothetical protein